MNLYGKGTNPYKPYLISRKNYLAVSIFLVCLPNGYGTRTGRQGIQIQMTDDDTATAFLLGFTGFAWTFAANFWSPLAFPALLAMTYFCYRQMRIAGWVSLRDSRSTNTGSVQNRSQANMNGNTQNESIELSDPNAAKQEVQA